MSSLCQEVLQAYYRFLKETLDTWNAGLDTQVRIGLKEPLSDGELLETIK